MTLAGFDSHDVFFSPISFLRAIFTFVDAPPGRYVVERARSRTTAASLAINETPVCMEQPAAELRLLRRPLLPVATENISLDPASGHREADWWLFCDAP